MSEMELTATELHKSVSAMATFFEDFYNGDAALKAKLRGFLSESFADTVGKVLTLAKENKLETAQ